MQLELPWLEDAYRFKVKHYRLLLVPVNTDYVLDIGLYLLLLNDSEILGYLSRFLKMVFSDIEEQSRSAGAAFQDLFSSIIKECSATDALVWHDSSAVCLLELRIEDHLCAFFFESFCGAFVSSCILFGSLRISLTIDAGPTIVNPVLSPIMRLMTPDFMRWRKSVAVLSG